MAGKGGSPPKITVHLPDRFTLEEVRAVVGYEARRSGRSFSQAAMGIVLEEAGMDDFPDEMRERVAELEAQLRAEAVARALDNDG